VRISFDVAKLAALARDEARNAGQEDDDDGEDA